MSRQTDDVRSFTALSSEFGQHIATIVTASNGAYGPNDISAIGARASNSYQQWCVQLGPAATHPVARIAVLANLLHDIEADGLLSALQLARYVSREVGVAGTKGDALALRVAAARTLNELQRAVDTLRRDFGFVDGPDVDVLQCASPPIGHQWPRWMTTDTCAAYIDRTVRGIEGLVRRGLIPFVKQGGRVYFDRDAIDRWMMNAGRRRAQRVQRLRDTPRGSQG